MDAKARMQQLMKSRGWTEYRLAKESGLSQSTVANIFNRNTAPTITTLESICNRFGITMSRFFAEGEMVELSGDLKELFDVWVSLTKGQKQALLELAKNMN